MTDADAPEINPAIVAVFVVRPDMGEVPPAGAVLMESYEWPDNVIIELWVGPKWRMSHENTTAL